MKDKLTNSQPAYVKEWSGFVDMIEERLKSGHLEYGDESFDKAPIELAEEAEQELLDIVGWSYILYCRMKRLKKFYKENKYV